MKILITGGEGVLGKYLSTVHFNEADTLDVNGNPTFKIDITADKAREIIVENNYDIILHLAAKVLPGESFLLEEKYANTNIVGVANILKAIREMKEKPLLVFFSSCAVYGDLYKYLQRPIKEEDVDKAVPTSPYGLSKLTGEMFIKMYAMQYGIDYVILRLGNIYSPFDNKYLLWKLFEASKTGKEFFLRGERMIRDYMYVDDLGELIKKIIMMYLNGEIVNGVYNVGFEPRYTIDVVRDFIKYRDVNIVATKKVLGEFDSMVLDKTRMYETFNFKPKYRMSQVLPKIIMQFESRWEEERK